MTEITRSGMYEQMVQDIIDNDELLYMLRASNAKYVFSSRRLCAKNGEFEKIKSSAVAYGWFVWIKGYKGIPEIKWI